MAVLLHLHAPELQELWQQQQQAEQRAAAAAASALNRVADTFLGAYGVFRSLVAAVADLDILAGFAQVSCAHQGLGLWLDPKRRGCSKGQLCHISQVYMQWWANAAVCTQMSLCTPIQP